MTRTALAALFAAAALFACSSEDVGSNNDEEHVAKVASKLETDPALTGLTAVSRNHATTASSSSHSSASALVDGVTSYGSYFATNMNANEWWSVDLTYDRAIEVIDITANSFGTSAVDVRVELLDAAGNVVTTRSLSGVPQKAGVQRLSFPTALLARKVRVVSTHFGFFAMNEVSVYARLIPASEFPIVRKDTAEEGVCWKKNYGRGAGKVPTTCGAGMEKNGALCYPTCKSGFTGNGPVCWGSCPSGFTDTGMLCQRNVKIISADNSHCSAGDKCGLTYDKGCSICPSGYHNDGCTCRLDAKTITKDSYTRGAGSLLSCTSDKEQQAGLCYNECNAGYQGVGPACWGECSGDYNVACGAACATSTQACEKFTVTVAADVGQMVVNLSMMAMSFGESAEAISVASEAGETLGTDAAFDLKSSLMKMIGEQGSDLSQDTVGNLAQMLVGDYQTGQIDWTQLDPTGIAAVVKALQQPTCK